MAIDFSPERWQTVREAHSAWWKGELDRPLLPLTAVGTRDPGRATPAAPMLSQATCHDLSWSAEQIVDRIDHYLSTCTFYGDAFPMFNLDCFGPGIAGAFLGATLDNSTGRVWFHPPADMPIQDTHFEFDPTNRWFLRIQEIMAAAMDRWQGQVLMGMPDLGGNLDILSTFLPGEKLLFELYDHPEHVKRLTWEAYEVWFRYYDALNEVLQPINPGYSDWSGIYSTTPGYILQCDFCYMIGPEMFEEFVKPELSACCRRLGCSFYHLDGPGQIPHLNSLLAIDELDGVQWVPGAGSKRCGEWPELYREIAAAGKLMQVFGDFDDFDALASVIGDVNRMHVKQLSPWARGRTDAEIRRRLSAYGGE